MGAAFQDRGLELFALVKAGARDDVSFDNVRFGTFDVAQRYDAASNSTPVDTSPTRVDFTEAQTLTQNGPNVVLRINLPESPALPDVREAYFYDGDEPVAVWANADSDIFTKAADTPGLVSFAFAFVNGVASALNVTFEALLEATPADMTALTNGTRFVSPRRLSAWWTSLTLAIGKLTDLIASTAETQLGESNEKLMSPLRTKEAILALAPDPHVITDAAPTTQQITDAAVGTIWLVYG